MFGDRFGLFGGWCDSGMDCHRGDVDTLLLETLEDA